MSPSIGIGITTRNRHAALNAGLAHFRQFHADNMRYVVVDDSSDTPYDDVVAKYPELDVVLLRSNTRLGIAAAKNGCLGALADCDHVFLFDDDAWARSEGWAERWIAADDTHGIGHSMYVNHLNERDDVYKIIVTHGEGDTAMRWWTNCMGLALHFNRACLDAIGGYDWLGARNVYGYEHAQISSRAENAGFTGSYTYASPAIIGDLVYSVDITARFHGELPPLGEIPDSPPTVTPEEHAALQLNSTLLLRSDPFVPLVNPFRR